MTAPAAPHITVRAIGTTLRVRWAPVTDATDYKLYAGAATEPTGLEADIADDDMGEDGWFQYTFVTLDDPTYVRLTALNLTAEESGYSNEVKVAGMDDGTGTRHILSDPFGAEDARDD